MARSASNNFQSVRAILQPVTGFKVQWEVHLAMHRLLIVDLNRLSSSNNNNLNSNSSSKLDIIIITLGQIEMHLLSKLRVIIERRATG